MDKIKALIKKTLSARDKLEDKNDVNRFDTRGRDTFFIHFLDCCGELAKTGDKKALLFLLDFFDDKFDSRFEGALERLTNYIMDNFLPDPALWAFCEKFENLINNNPSRFALISRLYFYDERDFTNFRNKFNSVKSKKSEIFINCISKSFGEFYTNDIKERVDLLREDMKKW